MTAEDLAEIRRAVADVLAEVAIAPPPRRSPYLTFAEAGALIHHEAETIRHWVWEGRLKGYKPGRVVLVKEAELLALVDASETTKKRAAKARAKRGA